jgi:hypothetical protein
MNGAIRTALVGSIVGGIALATVGATLYFMLLGCSNGGCNKNNNTTTAQKEPAESPPAPAAPPVYRLPAPVLHTAPSELAGLAIFVQDPYVADGQQYHNSPIIHALRGALVRAGYRVPLEARNVDAVVSLQGQTGGNYASYRLSVVAHGALVDQITENLSNVAPGHTLKCEIGECYEHAVIDMVNAMSRSPLMIAFGDNLRRQRSRPVVVAQPPPPVLSEPRTNGGPFATGAPQPGAWALVIGIERYRDVSSPMGARADAERWRSF